MGKGEEGEGGMKCLRHLLLGGNLIETLEVEGGCVLPLMVEVGFLPIFPPPFLFLFDSLSVCDRPFFNSPSPTNQYVDLKQNRLGSLPIGMGRYKKLFILKLNSNLLPSLPAGLTHFIHSCYMSLTYFSLSFSLDFGQIKNLKELDLSNNLLSDLPPSFSELHYLRGFFLSLSSFTFSRFINSFLFKTSPSP